MTNRKLTALPTVPACATHPGLERLQLSYFMATPAEIKLFLKWAADPANVPRGAADPDRRARMELRNVQAAARRRGFSVRRDADGFAMTGSFSGELKFEDLREVISELNARAA